MLRHILDGLATCRSLDGVIVATSTDASDDAIADFCRQVGVTFYRGSLDDVAGRLLAAAEAADADTIVRVSADSPLLDPALVDQGVALFRLETVDLASNVTVRSFPKGQSVEVISRTALARAVQAMTTPQEREHVTPHFYAHPEGFSIRSFAAATPRPEVQLSVDTPADLARCEAILLNLGQPSWQAGWEACVRAYDSLETGGRV